MNKDKAIGFCSMILVLLLAAGIGFVVGQAETIRDYSEVQQ